MQISAEAAQILDAMFRLAKNAHFEYMTPELMLYVICQNQTFAQAFENCGGSLKELDRSLKTYLEEYMEPDSREPSEPQMSQETGRLLEAAWESVQNSGGQRMELSHMMHAMYGLQESYAVYYMRLQGVEHAQLLQELIVQKEERDFKHDKKSDSRRSTVTREEEEDDADSGAWQMYARCLNDELEGISPLIGRKQEIERTMQILCRRDKNNPLHIGEPGTGKTALVYGLARLLKEGNVPKPLRGAKIFSMDIGSLLAGTQYRGDFEKRLKKVLDSIAKEEKPIIYIDEIHNITGAGAVNGGSLDFSNLLKPYLLKGHIRFIGATTYEEYKKHFEKNKSLARRFQNVEIKEPDTEEAVRILEGLKKTYEEFHGVCYEDGVLRYAVLMSAKYMTERFLPDKAIDLIDEAGAYRKMHPLVQKDASETEAGRGNMQTEKESRLEENKRQLVSRELIDEIVARTCQIPKQAVESDEVQSLATLEERMKHLVFGQDEAVVQAVNAVKFARAGLSEENKPLASLLFAGPTGVGKTEIAKSLAKELGISLIRFDMSEYTEKHAVSKLIGAPAGYVGYEEGGLLTDSIRKHPHAVLLLDEIEKAHPDIYNVLLQVMDDAVLTDNQGRKADFRNVIIIMTSNAGASRIGKPGIGFLGQDVSADIVLEEVKRIFQPEFRNRLNKIITFRGMDTQMAERIAVKKLGGLKELLGRKQIQMTADDAAKKLIQKKGISAEFGAREIERVIQNEIKPLFAEEILFGALKDGGTCSLTAENDRFRLLTAGTAGK